MLFLSHVAVWISIFGLIHCQFQFQDSWRDIVRIAAGEIGPLDPSFFPPPGENPCTGLGALASQLMQRNDLMNSVDATTLPLFQEILTQLMSLGSMDLTDATHQDECRYYLNEFGGNY